MNWGDLFDDDVLAYVAACALVDVAIVGVTVLVVGAFWWLL